eukprot:1138520-Pelagomonas_calceolata.AAC.2
MAARAAELDQNSAHSIGSVGSGFSVEIECPCLRSAFALPWTDIHAGQPLNRNTPESHVWQPQKPWNHKLGNSGAILQLNHMLHNPEIATQLNHAGQTYLCVRDFSAGLDGCSAEPGKIIEATIQVSSA